MMPKRSGNTNAVDPKLLAAMKAEDLFIRSQQRGARRIKMEKEDKIVVRILPARLGPEHMWYARVAKHWLNKVPITCPRLTGEDFGGNPEVECPVCLLANKLNDDRDKDVSGFGWRMMASPQYLTYCLLWQKNGADQPMSEIIIPYEFGLQKATWQELYEFYLAGLDQAPDSVLDYREGNDFRVIRTTKGTRLYQLKSTPIFDVDDPQFENYIKKIEAAMKDPKVQIPTADELDAFAEKVQEEAEKLHRHRGDDDDNRSRSHAARDQEQDAPRGHRARDEDEEGAPRSRRAPVGAAAEDDDDSDLGPQRPARRTPKPEAEDEDAPWLQRKAPTAEDAEPHQREEDPDARPTREPEPEADVDSETPPEQDQDAKVQARGKLPPTENRRRASAEPSSTPQRADDDEDDLPDDDKDKVPPAKTLPAKGKADSGDGEDLPKVKHQGAKLPEAFHARIAKLKGRE
ncbi:MAG: hypothetical protein NT154_15605 [Verrucomicrobia bacterium]|nr:hypothetical protein [Verrucomicrobiota bacterium]